MRFMRPRIPASAVQSMCCIALVLCLSSILGCDSKEKAVQPPKAGAGPPPEVTVVELTPQTVSIYRDFVALTYSVDMVEIRARVEGFIGGEIIPCRPKRQTEGRSLRARPATVSVRRRQG
jgi:hypothetical protein